MHGTRCRKAQAPREFLRFHVGLRSALRMCLSSRSMGQILLPQGQGPFLGSHTQRWSKAAAVTLRKCSPHPPHNQHILPAGQAQTYQPADTFLLLPAVITTFPLGTFKEFSFALLSHSAGLPYPWCESQCNSNGK